MYTDIIMLKKNSNVNIYGKYVVFIHFHITFY